MYSIMTIQIKLPRYIYVLMSAFIEFTFIVLIFLRNKLFLI